MSRQDKPQEIHRDPLGLGELPEFEPQADAWPGIRQALEAHRETAQRRRRTVGGLALAATVVLAVLVGIRQPGPVMPEPVQTATQNASDASGTDNDTVASLISLSQNLETQLRTLREGTSAMPASSAVYVAELEDLVAQVDQELSFSPKSVNLWGQRVNLLLDLAQIYQLQWELDYGQMASLQ